MKNCTRVLVVAALLGMAGSGLADEEVKRVMAIEVAGDSATDSVAFKWNSDESGFDLDDMQVGETRSIVDDQGQPILITRNEDGFSFNINGKVIDLPEIHELDGHGMHWVSDEDAGDVNVHVIKGTTAASLPGADGTVIISSSPIDEATRQSIQAILEAAGHSGGVEFIDHGDEQHGQVFIKRIEKVVEQS